MSSPANNSPLRADLNQTAYRTSKGKEISYAELAKCTGTSRSLPARYLSRLEVLVKGGGVITDAKVKEILNKNGYTQLNNITNQFRISAGSVSANATNIEYSAKQLKSDSKDLKRAGDLVKLFIKHQDKRETKTTTEGMSFIEKLHDKTETKRIRKTSTEPRELKEIENAKFILDVRKELGKNSPTNLFKTALWENSTIKDNKDKDSLSQDFYNFLNEQKTYPSNEAELKNAYDRFISKTLKDTKEFQSSAPFDRTAEEHKEKLDDYLKPKTNSLAQHIAAISMNPPQKNNPKDTLANKLSSNDMETLLKDTYEKNLCDSLQEILGNPSTGWLDKAKLLVELHDKKFQGENAIADHLQGQYMEESYDFLKDLAALSSTDQKGEQKMNTILDIITTHISDQHNQSALNITYQTKKDIESKRAILLGSIILNNGLPTKVRENNTDELINNLAIFDKAGEEIMQLLTINLRSLSDPSQFVRGTQNKNGPSQNDIFNSENTLDLNDLFK